MKKIAKSVVVRILAWQVKRLRAKKQFKVVAIAGSIGKTSTKFALAAALKKHTRVRFQEGNYNDIVSAPLVFFGLAMPSLLNPIAWLATFVRIEVQLHSSYPWDVVILEVGTDGPGQIEAFSKYLDADIGVLTAVAPEHMEYFSDLNAVAQEELHVQDLVKKLFINVDLVAPQYVSEVSIPRATYAINKAADYQMTHVDYIDGAYSFAVQHAGSVLLTGTHSALSDTQLYSVCAATAVAHELGLNPEEINAGIDEIEAVNGRMKHLKGINGSQIIDDTYNSSPVAAKAALDTLYRFTIPRRIAVLGNMNELGGYSEQAHTEVGTYCDPEKLEEVITIGKDANSFLASAAEKNGCKVRTFTNPYDAGTYLKTTITTDTMILVKGSQNGVFAEETVKLILEDSNDADKLVRQSPYWMKQKEKQFGKH